MKIERERRREGMWLGEEIYEEGKERIRQGREEGRMRMW